MALGRRTGDAVTRADYDHVIERLDRQHGRIAELEREVARLSPQVAAIEARIEDLRQAVERAALPAGDEAGVAAALERIEREHEQVRVRISAAARFEERLRQLEDRVGE
jgi:chromosome segregation ATPase